MEDMEWFSSIMYTVTSLQTASVFLKICCRVPNLLFLPITAQNWHDGARGTGADSGAGLTLHHQSLDLYGGHRMVQQHCVLLHASKQHQFCPKFAADCQPYFCQSQPKNWHGWAQVWTLELV
jgi:hypothetical protein